MSPPMVYDVTMPSSQRITRTTMMVSSMLLALSKVFVNRSVWPELIGPPCSPCGSGQTGVRRPWQAADDSRHLLHPHVVLDADDAFYAARDFDGLVDVGLGIDEAAQLNHALEGFDVDLERFQTRLIENGRLHFGGNDGIVHVFTRPSFRCRRRAPHDRNNQKRGKDGG